MGSSTCKLAWGMNFSVPPCFGSAAMAQAVTPSRSAPSRTIEPTREGNSPGRPRMVRLLALKKYDAQLSMQPLLACFAGLAHPGFATGYGQQEPSREREILKVISHAARKDKRHFCTAASARAHPLEHSRGTCRRPCLCACRIGECSREVAQHVTAIDAEVNCTGLQPQAILAWERDESQPGWRTRECTCSDCGGAGSWPLCSAGSWA